MAHCLGKLCGLNPTLYLRVGKERLSRKAPRSIRRDLSDARDSSRKSPTAFPAKALLHFSGQSSAKPIPCRKQAQLWRMGCPLCGDFWGPELLCATAIRRQRILSAPPASPFDYGTRHGKSRLASKKEEEWTFWLGQLADATSPFWAESAGTKRSEGKRS